MIFDGIVFVESAGKMGYEKCMVFEWDLHPVDHRLSKFSIASVCGTRIHCLSPVFIREMAGFGKKVQKSAT